MRRHQGQSRGRWVERKTWARALVGISGTEWQNRLDWMVPLGSGAWGLSLVTWDAGLIRTGG